jgi:hypothetical protein
MALDGTRADYYRAQARQARDMAERTRDTTLKQEYELIAEQYEKLALLIESGYLRL